LASLALLQVISVQAQTTAHTDPVGFINLTIKGANPDPAFTALSVPMISPVLYSGQFDGGAGFVLTDSSANWTADQINAFKARDGNNDATHYLEVTNHTDNTKVGLIVKIFDATSTTLTAQVDVSDLDGASYTIRKYQTLGGLFKDKVGVAGGLKAGSGANDADRVYKLGPDGAGGVEWFTYYYETGRSGGAWKRIGSSDPMDDVAIAHDEGLIVRRIEAGDVELTVPGGGQVQYGTQRDSPRF